MIDMIDMISRMIDMIDMISRMIFYIFIMTAILTASLMKANKAGPFATICYAMTLILAFVELLV